mgnify:CR=1
MNDILDDSAVLYIYPSVAKAIGLRPAIVFAALEHLADDQHMVTISAQKLRDEVILVWSVGTVREHLKKLEEMDIIRSFVSNEDSFDMTKTYQINYPALQIMVDVQLKGKVSK